MLHDRDMLTVFGGLAAVLVLATVTASVAKRLARGTAAVAEIQRLSDRIKSWWGVLVVIVAAIVCGLAGTAAVFALLSFLALREYITLQRTTRGDHRVLFWSFFVVTPVQYVLIGMGMYGLFTIFIPVYAFILLPIRGVMAGERERFLERMAGIQWGLLICVFFVSHVPALLALRIAGYEGQNVKLLFFFLVVVELNDAMQGGWLMSLRRRGMRRRTTQWAGAISGFACSALVGAALSGITPFYMWQASLLALMCAVLGFFGVRTLRAIRRRDRDTGGLLQGRGSVLDRIDSLCFAAPVFYHTVRFGWG